MLGLSLRSGAATSLAIAALAGSNGGASDSASQIAAAAKAALFGVRTVHVAGALSIDGNRLTLDLDLTNGKGGEGSISKDGLGLKVVVLGKKVYVDPSRALWIHSGGQGDARLAGTWLEGSTTGEFKAYAALTDVRVLFGQPESSHNVLVKGTASTHDGQPVIAIENPAKGETMFVATTGKPYPLQIVSRGDSAGVIDFSRFNAPVTITAPAHAIAVSQSP